MNYNTVSLILAIIFFLLIILSTIWWFQYKILFFPVQKLKWYPNFPFEQNILDITGKSVFKGVTNDPLTPNFTNSYPNTIHLWYFNFSGNTQNTTVLFCHGNNGNISYRSYIIDICKYLSLNVILFDYRGYGKSNGIPTQDTICQDGLAVYTYLSQFCPPENIIIWGESLGGAVAVDIASKRVCSHLICMCTFSSLDDIITNKNHPRWLTLPTSTLIKYLCNTLPNSKRIQNVKCPTVVMHSKNDEIIPYSCAKRLFDSISHVNKLFLKISGTHSSPDISLLQFFSMLRFCNIPLPINKDLTYINSWLDELKSSPFTKFS